MNILLISASISGVVGGVAAIMSFVKLINDKEHKTTEFRQEWTSSVRSNAADLIANIKLYADEAIRTNDIQDILDRLDSELNDYLNANEFNNDLALRNRYDNVSNLVDFNDKKMSASIEKRERHLEDVCKYKLLVDLHFKPGDQHYQPFKNAIEDAFLYINSKKHSLQKEEVDLVELKCNQASDCMRSLLKCEWDRIKLGEPAYQKTKRYLKYAILIISIALLFGFVIGVFYPQGEKNNNQLSLDKAIKYSDLNFAIRKFGECGKDKEKDIFINIQNDLNSEIKDNSLQNKKYKNSSSPSQAQACIK